MEISVRKLFDRYERFFNQPVGGDVDREGVASGSTGGMFFQPNSQELGFFRGKSVASLNHAAKLAGPFSPTILGER